MSAAVTPAVTNRSTWGVLTADGAGALDVSAWENRDTSVDGPHDQTGVPYSVGADRTLSIFDATSPSLVTARGRLSAQGDIGVLGSVTDGEDPEVALALRQGGTLTEASVQATWLLCGWWRSAAGPSALSGVITLGPGGTFDRTADLNTGGALSPHPLTSTWSLEGDGRFRLWVDGGALLEGGFLPNGEVAVAAGGDDTGDPPMLYVLVRENAPRTATDRGGTYFLSGIEYDLDAGEYVSTTGTIAMDGAGAFELQITRNEDGSFQPPLSDSGTYEVWPDSTLVLTLSSGHEVHGAVSLDGRFAMVGGGTTSGSNPLLWLFVK